MPGAGFMKHGADATKSNRTILKRNGRFNLPKNSFHRLKERSDRKSRMIEIKKARPELLEGIRKQIADQSRKSRTWDLVVGGICLTALIIFIWMIMSS